ncbi:MAG: type II toxin-antitoxin system VapC family toxin [Chloroflexi bacterium]|nr:type II toxin-antitoxin system VapC family toxin [Chloroflexota bacterium]
MKILLDTHAFLWWVTDDPRLPSSARAVISDAANVLMLSAASAWEMGIKVAKGTLHLPAPLPELLAFIVHDERLQGVDIGFEHALAGAALPPIHGDPFDRLLIAQAQAIGCPILTRDADIARYDVDVIW